MGSTERQAEHVGQATSAVAMLDLLHLPPSTYSSAPPDEWAVVVGLTPPEQFLHLPSDFLLTHSLTLSYGTIANSRRANSDCCLLSVQPLAGSFPQGKRGPANSHSH